jgi:predicted GNAT family acetyltransferase
MPIEVALSDDPAWVLTEAEEFLASEPVLHNLVLTLLHARVAHPEPGRYWVATDGGSAVGVVFQSPLDFAATLTPMEPGVVIAMADAIADTDIALPGVNGEAATAARFAGRWTERHNAAAAPVKGLRLYEARDIQEQTHVSGRLRTAVPDDRDLLVAWTRSFHSDTGERGGDPESLVDRRLSAGQLWVWDDGGPVSLAGNSERVHGVVRVQLAYTPPERRKRGYAGACVSGLSKRIRDGGYRCMLYTDLANPVSNAVFRRIGYRAVAEALRYQFV